MWFVQRGGLKSLHYKDVLKNFKGKDFNDIKKAFGCPTPLANVPITEDELRKINPWDGPEQFVKPIESPTVLFDENAACVLKCDEPYITDFNKQYKGTIPNPKVAKTIYREPSYIKSYFT